MKADIAYWALSSAEQNRLSAKRGAALRELASQGAFAALFSGASDPGSAQRFQASAWFRDLTGLNEPNAVLLLDGLSGEALLLLESAERAPGKGAQGAGSAGGSLSGRRFIRRLDAERSMEATGLAAMGLESLDSWLDERLALGRPLCLDFSAMGPPERRALDQALRWRGGGRGEAAPSASPVADFSALCASLRLIKDAREIGRARQAARVAALGHVAAMEALFRSIAAERRSPGSSFREPVAPRSADWESLGSGSPLAFAVAASGEQTALTERSLEAAFMASILSFGAEGPSRAPMVAAGENALVDHWSDNRRALAEPDWLVCDMGVRYQGFCAEIARSLPARGSFEGPQGEVYAALLSAQKKAIEACVDNANWSAPTQAAEKALAESLAELNLLRPEWVSRPQGAEKDWDWRLAALRRLTRYPMSHRVGREPLDIGAIRLGGLEAGQALTDAPEQKLRPGMLLAIGPGLYFDDQLPGLPQELVGFGLRLKDLVLVSPRSAPPEVLTALCPKEPSDLRLIAKACGLT